MSIRDHNRSAWNRQVQLGNEWTIPVSSDVIEAARRGDWKILVTSSKPVPDHWLPEVAGMKVLCLGSGGGQQGPILAAAGGIVTVLDNSPRQLEQDRHVAEREGLALATVEADMADLNMLVPGSFDAIVHPVSNVFVPNLDPVWREAHRVLRNGGILISGFVNPAAYLFDYDHVERTGRLEAVNTLPYSDVEGLSETQKIKFAEDGTPFEFSHNLEDQIGGQIAAGFVITGLFEDHDHDGGYGILNDHMPPYVATRALKQAWP